MQTIEKPIDIGIGGDTLGHIYCPECYPKPDELCFSYCGLDVAEQPEVPDTAVDCVVCIDIMYCPVCDSK